MEKRNIVSGVQESNNYPYGRLQCHITFQVEFKPKKGFRFVTQTTNPKTGKINKPKNSTYSQFMVMHKDENEHFKPLHFSIRGYEDIAKLIQFLTVNEIVFTPEQSSYMWAEVINCLRANAQYTRLKEGVMSDFLESLCVTEIVAQFKQNADFNNLKNIRFDLDKINSFRLCG